MARNRTARSGWPLLSAALLLFAAGTAGAWYAGLIPDEWQDSLQKLIAGKTAAVADPDKATVPPPDEMARQELQTIENDLSQLTQYEPSLLIDSPEITKLQSPSTGGGTIPAAPTELDLGVGNSEPQPGVPTARQPGDITKAVFEEETLPATEPPRRQKPSAGTAPRAKTSLSGRSGAATGKRTPAAAVSAAPESQSAEAELAGSEGLIDPQTIQSLYEKGEIPAAHLELSRHFWREPERRAEYLPQLRDSAEQLYFAPQPSFEEPYLVQPGDLLKGIARKHRLTWEYLARLNKIDPRRIRAGQKLKVTPGPFAALVSLSRHELIVHQGTNFVKSYPVGVGKRGTTPVGKFIVKNKESNPTYYGPEGVIKSDDPENPLGERWIDIGDSYGIHGTIDPQSIGKDESRGCVRMLNSDVEEVYDFLIIGSEVRIVR